MISERSVNQECLLFRSLCRYSASLRQKRQPENNRIDIGIEIEGIGSVCLIGGSRGEGGR